MFANEPAIPEQKRVHGRLAFEADGNGFGLAVFAREGFGLEPGGRGWQDKGNRKNARMSDEKVAGPRHVAIIMDGNGRWAKTRHRPRLFGHREGAESLRVILEACRKHGVEILTVYAFSTENWGRPKDEVDGLMRLLKEFLKKDEKELHKHETRLRVSGRLGDLPADVQAELRRVMAATEKYTKGQLVLALSYGGRAELAGLSERWPKDENGEFEAPVRLCTLSALDMRDELLLNMLEAYGIPCLRGYPGDGAFGKLVLGTSGTGSSIYVPETMYDEAKDLMEARPDDDVQS